jgi:hypothetical protein
MKQLLVDADRDDTTNQLKQPLVMVGKYHYHYESAIALSNPTEGRFQVVADATDNLHIGLADLPDDSGKITEIVVGGFNPAKSVIRPSRQGPTVAEQEGECLVKGGDTTVEVDYSASGITVTGVGQDGQRKLIVAYKGNPFNAAKYVVFSNWETPVTVKSVILK